MFRTGLTALLCATALSVAAPAALAYDTNTTIQFAKGSNQATVNGQVSGYDSANFLVAARAGQTMQVSFQPNSNSCYINIYGPRGNQTLYDGSADPSNNYYAQLRDDGTYTIEAYLTRNAAKQGTTCRFTLTVGVTGGSNQNVSDDQMRRDCQDEAANQFDVKPSRITLARDIVRSKSGWTIDGTADQGKNAGIHRFRCQFDNYRSLSTVQDLGPDQPQQNYTLPAGSWSQSCRNASIDRYGIMYAQCRDTKNKWRDTQLDVRTCKSAENVNGQLVCTQQQ